MSACPDCDADVVVGDNFCGSCGAELVPVDSMASVAADGRGEPVMTDDGDEPARDDDDIELADGGDESEAGDDIESVDDGDEPVTDGDDVQSVDDGDEAPDDEVVAADDGDVAGDKQPAPADSPQDDDGPSPDLFNTDVSDDDHDVAMRIVQVPHDDAPTAMGLEDHDELDPTAAIASVTVGVDLVECPSCASMNAQLRSRCARCGEQLREAPDGTDGFELAPLPARDDTGEGDLSANGEAGAPATTSSRRLPTWVLVVVAGILVGGAFGLATAAGVGPLAAPVGPTFVLDAEAYTQAPGPLHPDVVGGSSVLESVDGRRFAGSQLLDGDTATAWSPQDSDGTVEFGFDHAVWVTSIEVANGDQLDDEVFEATGRVRGLTIDFGHGQLVHATLIDGPGQQVVRLPQPALTDMVSMRVTQATQGEGVALTEVEFLGHRANDTDVAALEGG